MARLPESGTRPKNIYTGQRFGQELCAMVSTHKTWGMQSFIGFPKTTETLHSPHFVGQSGHRCIKSVYRNRSPLLWFFLTIRALGLKCKCKTELIRSSPHPRLRGDGKRKRFAGHAPKRLTPAATFSQQRRFGSNERAKRRTLSSQFKEKIAP